MNIGRCFNEAIEIYKKNLAQLVVAAFLYQVLSLISLLILLPPLTGGMILMTVNAIRRKDGYVDLADLFRSFGKFLPLWGVVLVTLLPMLLGLVLCVVPFVLLCTIWIFPMYLIVDRDEGVFASLGESNRIVMEGGFGNYLILVVLEFAIVIAPEVIPYAGVVIGWFVSPIAWLIVASAYCQQVEKGLPPAKEKELLA